MKSESDMEDELRSQYDLKQLRVRKFGSARKSFGDITVRLEPDVAAMFPTADAVNEALRFLMRAMQEQALKTQLNRSVESIDENI